MKNYFYYFFDNNLDNLIYIKLLGNTFNKIEENYNLFFSNNIDLSNNIISFDIFKKIVDNDKIYSIILLNNLISNFTNYPISSFKNELDMTFKKIIYYTLKFINNINISELKLNVKIKNLYIYIFNILKTVNDYNFLYDIKLYYKNLYFNIFKIILFEDNFLNITNKKVIDIFNNNYFSYILFKELEWSKINIQIDHYKYIYSS